MDFRGDPSSALLEVLDPEQNVAFNDHYLDIDYDLSEVFFITTANNLHGIPVPLQDRMEIIQLNGYTEEEKLKIAEGYPDPQTAGGQRLQSRGYPAYRRGHSGDYPPLYPRGRGPQSGAQSLPRLCRKVARDRLKKESEDKKYRISAQAVVGYLGTPKYRYGLAEEQDEIGLTTGLAWTEVGGELLQIETTLMPGAGKLTITGKLGDVMQESAQAALSYVRSRAGCVWGWNRIFTRNSISISMSRKGRSPRMGRRPVSPLPPPWSRRLLKVPVAAQAGHDR